jgi:hypothetical protein
MSTIAIVVNVTGAIDAEDRGAMLKLISEDNARREGLVPPRVLRAALLLMPRLELFRKLL